MVQQVSEKGSEAKMASFTSSRQRSRKRKRRGAALVEFALCASLLFLFMLAMIEFSRILQIQHVVREAAFEGTRAAASLDAVASNGATPNATSQINKVLAAGNLVNVNYTVTDGNGNALAYSSSTATVSISVDPAGNSWFMKFVTPGHPITATITLNREIQAVSVPGS